jgi:hypothetical protein
MVHGFAGIIFLVGGFPRPRHCCAVLYTYCGSLTACTVVVVVEFEHGLLGVEQVEIGVGEEDEVEYVDCDQSGMSLKRDQMDSDVEIMPLEVSFNQDVDFLSLI